MNNDIAEEILSAVNEFSEKTDRRLEKLEESMKDVRSEIKDVRSDTASLRSQMVTKDYLDDKIADLRGDLVVLTRKEDAKLHLLVEKPCERKVLDEQDKQDIFKMEPFPQLHL